MQLHVIFAQLLDPTSASASYPGYGGERLQVATENFGRSLAVTEVLHIGARAQGRIHNVFCFETCPATFAV